jgi:hypothetical protein
MSNAHIEAIAVVCNLSDEDWGAMPPSAQEVVSELLSTSWRGIARDCRENDEANTRGRMARDLAVATDCGPSVSVGAEVSYKWGGKRSGGRREFHGHVERIYYPRSPRESVRVKVGGRWLNFSEVKAVDSKSAYSLRIDEKVSRLVSAFRLLDPVSGLHEGFYEQCAAYGVSER